MLLLTIASSSEKLRRCQTIKTVFMKGSESIMKATTVQVAIQVGCKPTLQDQQKDTSNTQTAFVHAFASCYYGLTVSRQIIDERPHVGQENSQKRGARERTSAPHTVHIHSGAMDLQSTDNFLTSVHMSVRKTPRREEHARGQLRRILYTFTVELWT